MSLGSSRPCPWEWVTNSGTRKGFAYFGAQNVSARVTFLSFVTGTRLALLWGMNTPTTHHREATMDAAERGIIARLADYLEESHHEAGAMLKDAHGVSHHGGGAEGCVYCEAIDDARTILASDARATAEAKTRR